MAADRQRALSEFALLLEREDTAEVPAVAVAHLQPGLDELIAAGALVRSGERVRFFHESLRDFVYARAFVDSQGDRLAAELLRRGQDLSARPLVRQVLSYQRGLDRIGYTRSVRSLLDAENIRFHLRDVVFSVMRDDPDPQPEDWEIIERFVVDRRAQEHQVAWAVTTRPAWFMLVDRQGIVLRWLAHEDSDLRDAATDWLGRAQRHAPDRVASILEPFLPLTGDWSQRIRYVLTAPGATHTTESADLLRRSIVGGVFDDGREFLNIHLWMAVHDLPETDADAAAQLLASYIERGRALQDAPNPFADAPFPRSDHWLKTFTSDTARAGALPYANAVLPLVVDIAEATAEPADEEDETRRGDPWFYRWSRRRDDFEWALFYGLDEALRRLARSRPTSFRRLSRTLLPHSSISSLRYLLYRGWAANPEAFSDEAAAFLLTEAQPFVCGDARSDYNVTADLLRAMQVSLDPARLHALQARILAYVPAFEQSERGADYRGSAQWRLLDGFAEDSLSAEAAARRQQLRTKFGGRVEDPPAFWSGAVGPPIPEPEAQLLSDEQWIDVMREYNADDTRSSGPGLVGGVHEQAQVLETETKRNPDRFARLGAVLRRDIHPAYGDAVLRGLGDAEALVRPDLLFDLLRHQFRHPERPHGRWIQRPLARAADDAVPDDVLEIVCWYATEDPDPSGDEWRGNVGTNSFPNDPLNAGINSTRGVAAQALSALVHARPERITALWPALLRVVADRAVAVRACAALVVGSVLTHDRERGLELFDRLVAADDILWASPHVERLIAYTSRRHFDRTDALLGRMLASPQTEVREAGGRQAALAALFHAEALELADRAVSGDAAARKGVAEVAAANVGAHDVRERCEAWLLALFDDHEEDVRQAASAWCRSVDSSALAELRGLVLNFIDSLAYRENEDPLLWALDDSTAEVADLGLYAIESFVARRRNELGDIRTSAAGSARTASTLAFRAYASASSSEMRERSLDVIDELLSARESHMDELVAAYDASHVGQQPT